jgi:putative protease
LADKRIPELLATPGTMEEVMRFADAGATAFVIGESSYAVRQPGEFHIDDVREAVRLSKERDINVYVAVNALVDNALLSTLPSYLRELAAAGVNGIVFGDPAVLMTVRSENLPLALHWNAEMTSTNYATANYWGRRGASRAVLARELNMEQVLDFKANSNLEIQVQVHGMTNIYHSKRSLLQSYLDHQAESGSRMELTESADTNRAEEAGLFLIEVERPGERFPIYEDAGGTHIMSSDDVCMLENLHELMEAGVDSFKLEGLLKSTAYNETVIRAYRKVMDTYLIGPEGYRFQEEWLEPIRELQDPHRELSFGFFYKEQVY